MKTLLNSYKAYDYEKFLIEVETKKISNPQLRKVVYKKNTYFIEDGYRNKFKNLNEMSVKEVRKELSKIPEHMFFMNRFYSEDLKEICFVLTDEVLVTEMQNEHYNLVINTVVDSENRRFIFIKNTVKDGNLTTCESLIHKFIG